MYQIFNFIQGTLELHELSGETSANWMKMLSMTSWTSLHKGRDWWSWWSWWNFREVKKIQIPMYDFVKVKKRSNPHVEIFFLKEGDVRAALKLHKGRRETSLKRIERRRFDNDTRMRWSIPVIRNKQSLVYQIVLSCCYHLKYLNKSLPSCSTFTTKFQHLLIDEWRYSLIRLCSKNITTDHRELNYLTGVTNTVCSKQGKNIITTHSLLLRRRTCAYSWMVQDNDMTDEKKNNQIKCVVDHEENNCARTESWAKTSCSFTSQKK